jgi:predicted nucleic acid-binding protein
MNGRAFVDTNILIYAHDQADREKNHRAVELLEKLWADRRGVLSTQVLQEFTVNLQKKLAVPLEMSEIRRRIQYFVAWEVVTNTAGCILQALDLQERYRVSFWDSMILQAAERGACEVLYSEDFSHGQEYSGVLVINPFVV